MNVTKEIRIGQAINIIADKFLHNNLDIEQNRQLFYKEVIIMYNIIEQTQQLFKNEELKGN